MTTAPVPSITEELLQELEQKARACLESGPAWHERKDFFDDDLIVLSEDDKQMICAATPATILTLIATIRAQAAELEDYKLFLEDAEHRAANAGRNSSAFEDRMGDLQVENGKLRAELERGKAAGGLDIAAASESIAGMAIEWVEMGVKNGADWQSGLPRIIARRLARFAAPAAPAQVAQEPHTFWVLFDATAEQRFIKKMIPEGFLAFFDCEGDAQRTMARNPGTAYKRVDYYTAPPATEQPDSVKAMRALLNRIVPRLDAGGPNPIDPELHHCEYMLYRERERIHAEFEALLGKDGEA